MTAAKKVVCRAVVARAVVVKEAVEEVATTEVVTGAGALEVALAVGKEAAGTEAGLVAEDMDSARVARAGALEAVAVTKAVDHRASCRVIQCTGVARHRAGL